MENSNLLPFEGKEIRKIWHDEQWFFSVVDIIEILTGRADYWHKLKHRETQLLAICEKFKFLASDGKMRPTDCANTEGVFRIIMSVPSPKAEPLKMWLAEQGKRSIDEAENPELLTDRQKELYKAKGYSEEWIKRRMQTIETRKELTDEWQKRGVKEGQEYSLLTAIVAKGTFGMTPSEHKDLKGLTKPSHELRDHMTPLELIFTALGEELTKQTAITENAQGFNENHDAATKGGNLAGKYRKDAEKKGFKVISKDNFLPSLKDGKLDSLPENNEPKE
jgi:DNA-damage-inducible protein D